MATAVINNTNQNPIKDLEPIEPIEPKEPNNSKADNTLNQNVSISNVKEPPKTNTNTNINTPK